MSPRARKPDRPPAALFGRACPGALAVDPAFRGILLAPRVAPLDGAGALWIDGVVQLERKDVEPLRLRPIQRLLVATVMSGYHHASTNLAADRVLFPEDEEATNGALKGCFAFDFARFFGRDLGADCYLMVTAGPFSSEVLVLANLQGHG